MVKKKAAQSLRDALRTIRDPSGDGTTKVSIGFGGGEMKELKPLPPETPKEKNRFKIPPDAEAGILERAGKGDSLREICAWLEKTHGISVTPTAIRKKLTKRRAEREVVAKAVVREHIAKTVTSDLEHLDRERNRLSILSTKLFNSALKSRGFRRKESADSYRGVVDCLRKVIDTKLHYSGADTPDDGASELAAAEERLTSKLARLRASETGDVPGDTEPPGEGGS